MRKRLTENVIDVNNCERSNNERKYVIWKKNRRRIDDEKQQRHKRDTLIND